MELFCGVGGVCVNCLCGWMDGWLVDGWILEIEYSKCAFIRPKVSLYHSQSRVVL